MKKVWALLLAVVLLAAGCAKNEDGVVPNVTPKCNEIAFQQLAEGEQDMVMLLAGEDSGAEVLRFAYNIEDMSTLEVWLDVYHDGEKQKADYSSLPIGPGKQQGTLTFANIPQHSESGSVMRPGQWRLQVKQGEGSNNSYVSTGTGLDWNVTSAASTYSHDAHPIRPEEEIVLAEYYYSTSEASSHQTVFSAQLTENLTALDDTEYLVVPKCRFSAA